MMRTGRLGQLCAKAAADAPRYAAAIALTYKHIATRFNREVAATG
jgi:hypothetical protein